MVKTLYIGIGGFGSRVVLSLKRRTKRISRNTRDFFVAVDSDKKALQKLVRDNMPYVNVALGKEPIGYYVNKYEGNIEQWLPTTPLFLNSRADMMSSARVLGRFQFLEAMNTGKLDGITKVIEEMMLEDPSDKRIRIVIVNSLAGGTGSGMFIQMALWVRRYLEEHWDIDGEIFGFFVGSEVFINSFASLNHEQDVCDNLRGNAYAALKELEILSNLKIGAIPPLKERICIDGLFDTARKDDIIMPIYDEVYVYDGKMGDDENLSYHDHITRLVRNIYLRLHKEELIKPALLFNRKGLRLNAFGSAVAEYPRREVVTSVAIKSVGKLVDAYKNTDTSDNGGQNVERLIEDMKRLIKYEIYKGQPFVGVPRITPEEFASEGETYIRKYLQYLHNEATALLNQAPSIHESMVKKIIPTIFEDVDFSRNTIYSLFCERCESGALNFLSPDTAKGRLEKLKDYLEKTIVDAQESKLFNFFEEPDGMVDFFNNKIEPSEDVEYSILVWEKNKPARANKRKQFEGEYLEWFKKYCNLFEKRSYQTAFNAVIITLFQRLMQEADELLGAMEDFRSRLNEIANKESDECKKLNYQRGNIFVGYGEEVEKRLEAFVHPYDNIGDINECYFNRFVSEYCNYKGPERMRKSSYYMEICLKVAFWEMVGFIQKSIFEADSDIVDLEVMEALKREKGEWDFENSLDKLCNEMFYNAQIDFSHFCQNNARTAKWLNTCFVVSKECEYCDDVCERTGYGAFIDREMDKRFMLCAKIAQGFEPEESLVMLQKPAYRNACVRFVSNPVQSLGVHIDKRWTLWLNGVFLDE